MELQALQLVAPQIESLGATLVAVSPQLPEKSLGTAIANKVKFLLLSDVGNRVTREFGLVFILPEWLRPIYRKFGIDIPAANGDESYELPISATYIIDREGTIVHAFVDSDYTKRLEPDQIVEILRTIAERK
ncbi:MAG TPA: redoxin domain-containing protein [Thermodesulfobacteriota bacterium]|nr:redoxin domain-containing protein [Thermodesulfobacteriota bacterium]